MDALINWRALFERSELARPPSLASISFHKAGRGVTGFGYFCRNKSGSAAGPNPGNTEKHDDTEVWYNKERRIAQLEEQIKVRDIEPAAP